MKVGCRRSTGSFRSVCTSTCWWFTTAENGFSPSLAEGVGNGRNLTLQAVTTIELTPADVCADCGERLLEELEIKDRA